MSDYLKSTNFATKDSLPSGNAGKIVKGTEIDNEFNAIADAIESKADLLNPTFSGLLTTDTLTTGGATNIGGTLAVAGALTAADDVQFTGTGRLLFPKGTTAQRPVSPVSGSVRYNTTLGYLENYNGTEWLAVGYVTPADVSDKVNTSTGYFQVPVGNIAQRPVSPAEGLLRYNSESDIYEGYINGAWHRFLTANQGSYNINYVAVGGGGGTKDIGSSGYWNSGGAGGGQLTASTTSVTPGTTVLTITIGGGGALGVNGSASVITGVVSAIGGYTNPQVNTNPNGGASGNGYTGGSGNVAGDGNGQAGGGGAGAGGNGGNWSKPFEPQWTGGDGGVGVETLITGTSQVLAGGGGGGAYAVQGTGFNGGGNGAQNGTVNTGGGAGGVYEGVNQGRTGGSGVVFLSMPTVNYTGTHTGSPTIITTGSNTVLKFTGSGTYTC
jgi:hypothetical protein